MTTTLPVLSPFPTAPTAPTAPAAPAASDADGTGGTGVPVCAVALRAAHSAGRDLAGALTGIAFDAPCLPERQRAIVRFASGVLPVVRALAERTGDQGLTRACAAAEDAGHLFASCISTGAPALARAWIDASERLAELPAAHGHAELSGCLRDFRSPAALPLAVPWFLDACSPRERVELLDAAPWRVRLALRLGEDRWLDLRDAVRG